MRMFSEQEAVALVLSALLNELLKFRAGIRVGLELQQIQAAGHIVFSSRCCRSWQNLDTFDFIGISCSHQENAKEVDAPKLSKNMFVVPNSSPHWRILNAILCTTFLENNPGLLQHPFSER